MEINKEAHHQGTRSRRGTVSDELSARCPGALAVKISTPAHGPPPGGTVYERCYDDPPAAAEANDQAATVDVQVFPDYDQYEPGPVYDGVINRRAPVLSCRVERPPHHLSRAETRRENPLTLSGGPQECVHAFSASWSGRKAVLPQWVCRFLSCSRNIGGPTWLR